MSLVPYVVEQTARGERSYDIFSRLLNDRIIVLSEDVNSASASVIVAQLLYLLARRRQRTRKQSPRARAEQEQAALVESVRLYFAQNIEKPLALDQVCDANGCSRVALQQAFRARTRMGPMEYFSCMKAEQAALLLTQGYGPGETARMLGYGSLAWFSRRFHALTGQTPGAYRRAPHPLHLCER